MLVTLARYAAPRPRAHRARRSAASSDRGRRDRARHGHRADRARARGALRRPHIPMDDALVHVAIDLGGRPYYAGTAAERLVRALDALVQRSTRARRCTCACIRGRDRHHVVEAAFKALGARFVRRSRSAVRRRVFSTKGAVGLEVIADARTARGRLPRRRGRPGGEGRRSSCACAMSAIPWISQRATSATVRTRSSSSTSRRAPRSARRCSMSRGARRSGCSFRSRSAAAFARRTMSPSRCAPAPTR